MHLTFLARFRTPAMATAVEGSEQPFKDYWASTIYPKVKEDYERLMLTTPIRIAEREKAKKRRSARRRTRRMMRSG